MNGPPAKQEGVETRVSTPSLMLLRGADYFAFGTVLVPLFVVPFGPVAVALTVEVPLPLLVVVPLALVVPPLGPVTVAVSAVPVRVFWTVAVPLAVVPLAEVAVAVPVAVVPLVVTEVVAVPPCFVL